MINGLFNPSIAEAITSIPLATTVQDNILIWHWTYSGIYSVKSGDRIIASHYVETEEAWQSGFWKTLWSLKVPTKTLEHFHKVWEVEFFESFIMGLWSVWLSHNELKWDQVEEGPYHVITRARSMLASWKKAQLKSSDSSINVFASNQWLPLPASTFKINFDAALLPSVGHGAFGAVISNCHGGFVCNVIIAGLFFSSINRSSSAKKCFILVAVRLL
ncbi:uncharacterized protein LOC119371495 [Jatropha curcas]|uniref:uncharacterized protein LOC119371495 n=1 Tax=Jatropha curcas TaxID=180498 RepID=UPI001893A5E3|nr:uncharacterized protein LOC119371495 [Jatropha curcas]